MDRRTQSQVLRIPPDGVKMFFDGANQGLLKGSILSHKNVLAHRKVFQGEQNLSFLAARQSH